MTEGKIAFSEGAEDITDMVLSGSSYVAAQNGRFSLELTSNADIAGVGKLSLPAQLPKAAAMLLLLP